MSGSVNRVVKIYRKLFSSCFSNVDDSVCWRLKIKFAFGWLKKALVCKGRNRISTTAYFRFLSSYRKNENCVVTKLLFTMTENNYFVTTSMTENFLILTPPQKSVRDLCKAQIHPQLSNIWFKHNTLASVTWTSRCCTIAYYCYSSLDSINRLACHQ